MQKTNPVKTEEEVLKNVFLIVRRELDKFGDHTTSILEIYDNQSLMKTLNVSSAYLKKLRDEGYISFSRHGDKYWYTKSDIERFLSRFHYEDFAAGDMLPQQMRNIHG